MGGVMIKVLGKPGDEAPDHQVSIADLFLQASRELAYSDARLYRSVDRHLSRTREILRQAVAEPDGGQSHSQSVPVQSLLGEPSFDRQTRRSLERLCKEHGIRGYSRMKKATMILRLKDAGVAEPAVPMEALTKVELLTILHEVFTPPGHDA